MSRSAPRDVFSTFNASGEGATRVLDVPISTVNLGTALNRILGWIETKTAHYICVRDVHGVMRAQDDPELMRIHEEAGLVTPDGMPLVWISRMRGYDDVSRVCGADLVDVLCGATARTGARHYFYGGKDGVAERMVAVLKARYPNLTVAGLHSPPFGRMTPEEDEIETARISASQPDIVWVGLSTPKQEFWMRDHVGRIPGATLVGVGAAFDFYAGDVKRAPRWMRDRGLEWLHRLGSEPRRLWRRYLVMAPRFVALVAYSSVFKAKK